VQELLGGQRALITGASRGLGAALARTFWSHGADLLLVARSQTALAALAEELRPQRPAQQVAVLAVDLAAEQAVDAVADGVRRLWNAADVLVNNAAILGPLGRAWENDRRQWEETLRINLLAPVALCRALVPAMIARGRGRIVNLSGGGATGPRPNFSAYGTAKAGLVRFSETLAQELRGTGVEVNCLAPGAMNTAMLTAVLDSDAQTVGASEFQGAQKQQQTGGVPPEKAAQAAAFLASPASAGITGKLISAVWDPWPELPAHLADLQQSDVYTLRRIVPRDRGLAWGQS